AAPASKISAATARPPVELVCVTGAANAVWAGGCGTAVVAPGCGCGWVGSDGVNGAAAGVGAVAVAPGVPATAGAGNGGGSGGAGTVPLKLRVVASESLPGLSKASWKVDPSAPAGAPATLPGTTTTSSVPPVASGATAKVQALPSADRMPLTEPRSQAAAGLSSHAPGLAGFHAEPAGQAASTAAAPPVSPATLSVRLEGVSDASSV